MQKKTLGIRHEIALKWIPQNVTNEKSALAQGVARSSQATSHYLSQCRPKSMSSYDVIIPQWVN